MTPNAGVASFQGSQIRGSFAIHPNVHSMLQAYIPLVTVLLAISEQQFFVAHWHNFLVQVLMHNIRVRQSYANS